MVFDLPFDEAGYLALLEKLIGESEHVQDNPPNFIPKEDLIGDHVLADLKSYTTENGGPIIVKRITYVEGRNNIILEYPAANATPETKSVSFVGSHMDVVTANPADWERDPFKLTIEGDKLYGRGTTDCLGHVAMITRLFIALAEKKVELKRNLFAVFIANEECSEILGIGVDELVKHGELERLKNGPVYWVDSADTQPCIGTGGVCAWNLTAYGKIGHSGLPQNAINPIILAHEGLVEIMRKFHEEFAAHGNEKVWNYSSPSTMKPTQVKYPGGSLNQIPGEATICGDIRLTPFYESEKVVEAVARYVKEVNENVGDLPTRGPVNCNVLEDGSRGRIEFQWQGEWLNGIACDINGEGFKALAKATEEVVGECKPSSLTGSLPCVRELQEAGFDIQIVGYGVEEVYHAANEYATLSGMKDGFKIFTKIINFFNDQ